MSRFVLLAVVGLTVVSCKDRSADRSTATPVSVSQLVRAQLLAAFPGATVTNRDPHTLEIERGDWNVRMNLDNLEATCTGGDQICHDAIASAIANIKPEAGEAPVTPDDLVVTIKDKTWFDDTDAMIRGKFPDKYAINKLTAVPMAGGLVAVLAVDRPNGIQMLSGGQLVELALDAKAAFDHAKQNLRAGHEPLKLSPMADTGVFTNDEDDNYIAATMFSPELWTSFASRVKGDLLVAFPARNRVFATGSADGRVVTALARVVKIAAEGEPHPITTKIFQWSPTGWTVHELP